MKCADCKIQERMSKAQSYCAQCKNKRNQISLLKPANKRVYRCYMKEWRKKNPAKRLIANARDRANAKGIAFSIIENDLLPLPSHCPVLGIKLKLEGAGRKCDPASPTLDRIDNTKGYSSDNIIVVSWRANNLKRDASMKELQQIINFYSDIEACDGAD